MFTIYLSAQGRATGIGCRASIKGNAIDTKQGLWFPLSIDAK